MTHLLDQLSPWEVVTYDDTNVAAMLEQLWTCIANIQVDFHVFVRSIYWQSTLLN